LRELAGVLVASREVGTGGGADLTAQLQALAASGAPWRYTARELLAVAQMEAGDTESARRTLGELIDDAGTPINLRRRAGELLESLGGPIAEEAAQ
jgi:hypothetical protein